ncbi:putative Y protein [human papillomavirus 43]|uniref:Putative Y protein n=1 Tax=Human papillomavirus 43 TaxID=10591 RepID=Q705H1_HPV43|nr:putative Y protein [human papillomavirus 43]
MCGVMCLLPFPFPVFLSLLFVTGFGFSNGYCCGYVKWRLNVFHFVFATDFGRVWHPYSWCQHNLQRLLCPCQNMLAHFLSLWRQGVASYAHIPLLLYKCTFSPLCFITFLFFLTYIFVFHSY